MTGLLMTHLKKTKMNTSTPVLPTTVRTTTPQQRYVPTDEVIRVTRLFTCTILSQLKNETFNTGHSEDGLLLNHHKFHCIMHNIVTDDMYIPPIPLYTRPSPLINPRNMCMCTWRGKGLDSCRPVIVTWEASNWYGSFPTVYMDVQITCRITVFIHGGYISPRTTIISSE